MLNHVLSPDTQAILLLCASFGQNRQMEPQPLTLGEYNSLAGWLLENEMSPGDLLDSTFKNRLSKISIGKLDSDRLVALLERGVMLGLAVEKWTNQGLWVLGRGDSQYPKRLKQRLRHSAPAILYGIGNIELLSEGGLAVVGSRDVDEEGVGYTQRVAQTCAEQGIQVVSGGARGVDSSAMLAVLEAGGTAVGVLADSLSKAAVAGKYRAGIKEGRLTLISAVDPGASFNAGNAMGRNKYIYALGDYALVVSSSVGKGGTWAGATEALERIKDVPIFVRMQGTIPEGNRQLLKKGAKPLPVIPASSLKGRLRTLLEAATPEVKPTKTKVEATDSELADILANKPSLVEPLTGMIFPANESATPEVKATKAEVEAIDPEVVDVVTNKASVVADSFTGMLLPVNQPSPKDIYEAVLPFILNHLEKPKDAKSLAECLDVRKGQVEDWLSRALKEGKVIKTKKPVAYVANKKPALLSLLEKKGGT
ncbi:DNA-protecting protein DprA [Microcoleus sp. FACHB-53]|nr:DNA-protecting protein DprA [Microcoleus sp. FACHB-53]MBD2126263.1 DNA-protecting protein DprA [Microcoleus sp. FACHB-1]